MLFHVYVQNSNDSKPVGQIEADDPISALELARTMASPGDGALVVSTKPHYLPAQDEMRRILTRARTRKDKWVRQNMIDTAFMLFCKAKKDRGIKEPYRNW